METPENLCIYTNLNGPIENRPEAYSYEESKPSPPYQFNVVPFQVEDNLDFIDIFEDGTTLLGSSNINGKYWNGSIWSFQDADLAPHKDKSLTGFALEFGVTCGKFLGSSQNVVVGDEGGGVSTIKLQEMLNAVHCVPLVTSYCHDQAVSSLTVSRDSLNIVTSSMDASIIIWENENLVQVKKYSPAHSREVTCVSASKFHTDLIFGSTSLDGTVIIWDHRESKPAFCLKDDESEPLTCLDWRSENEIAFASSFGSFYFFDLRNQQLLHSERAFNIPIVNIKFNKYGLLAVSGVWDDILVWDFDSKTSIYRDTRHSGLIHGMCWHPKNDRLYSCGGHQKLYRHDIDLSAYTSKLDQLKIS